MRALFAGEQVLVGLPILGTHDDVDDGIDASRQVDEDVAHHVDGTSQIHLFAQALHHLRIQLNGFR